MEAGEFRSPQKRNVAFISGAVRATGATILIVDAYDGSLGRPCSTSCPEPSFAQEIVKFYGTDKAHFKQRSLLGK
ncbi:predicted protein [Sclerotinia sclerotiorum 1980 UF-70]|uniref:Uncharacterized protein n=1 Tax=Sclerotinia sclerotiorum (strain ATCC 18683 / 1980 / Ss-1) TaxID=665079 RepID=A7EXK8_SCLS1|nr:predicted protein [Sclerotinia sclerotiorum 1980 UF-70]EDN94200.1 predicted protein [Sclerotinia sclerotiorum 1980 UF-70]